MKRVYEVTIHEEYRWDYVWTLRDKYKKWFKTKKEAIAYARSIKNELKAICRAMITPNDNIVCLDVDEYFIDNDELYEERNGIVYSLNIVGRY